MNDFADELSRLAGSGLQALRLKLDATLAERRGDLDFGLWLQANKDNIMLALTAAGVVLALLALKRRR